MSRFTDCILEQQALIVLLLERKNRPLPGERAFSSTHARRALYAHIAVVRDIVAASVASETETMQLQAATATVVNRLSELIAASGSNEGDCRTLLAPLTAMFSAEHSVMATVATRLEPAVQEHLAIRAEESFEALYGHGELSAERGASQFGAL